MSLVNQEQSKRLLSVHGWSGTVLGAVLYVVILTGTIVVFASEIGRWSAGGAPTVSAFDRPVDATLRALAADVDPTHMDEMFLYAESSGNLIVNFHAHRTDEETGAIVEEGTIFTLDPKDFSVIDRYDGVLADRPVKEDNAFGDFLVSVHVNLYAPFPYGLYATGLLGFVMLIAVISGIILHKHIIKDLFVRPRWSSLLLNRRDRHILAGSWSLPFGFLLAFTGTFYSFATSIGLPVVAMTAFGGDQEAVIEAIVASPMEPDETPMPMANIDTMIALSTENARGVLPLSMSVSHWGRADAYVSFFHEADAASLTGAPHALKGATGEYLGPRPLIGSEPSAASSVAGLMAPLHFGNFGGLLSKIVWFSLGLALSYVTITGLQLWVQRREEERAWAWMGRAVTVTTWGTVVAICASGLAFFVGLASGTAQSFTIYGFLGGAALSIVMGFVAASRESLSLLLIALSCLLMVLLPVFRMAFGGPDWGVLFATEQAVVLGMDIALIIGPCFILCYTQREWIKGRLAARQLILEPAE